MFYRGLGTPLHLLYFRSLLSEILYATLPPMLPSLQSDILVEYDQNNFLKSLEALDRVQKQLGPAICHVYESAPILTPTALNQVTKSRLSDITTRLWNLTVEHLTL